MVIAVLVLLGLVLGSFVNALVWRLHEQGVGEEEEQGKKKSAKADKSYQARLSILRGRSMCSHCHHELAAKDLAPLFSWLMLRGKCRYCGVSIQDNPLIEALLPVFFAWSYLAWPLALTGRGLFDFAFWLVFLTGFMALAAYDLRWFLLPNRIVYPLMGLAAVQVLGDVLLFGGGWHVLVGALWGVVVVSGLFYVLFQVSGGNWIGGGDVKLGVVLGLLAGGALRGLLLIFIASVLGTLVALPLLIAHKSRLTSRIPFGPYLLAATVIVVLYGDQLISTYLRAFGLQ